MDGKNNGSFWPSYVDIMTTLFAIMLVLFAVSFFRFKIKENEYKELTGELNKLVLEYKSIIAVYKTVGSIDSTRYFGYNEQYLKHLFTINVEYQTKEYKIDKLELDKVDVDEANRVRSDVVEAGNVIMRTIQRLENNDSIQQNNIKFLVVIEGQSSRIPFSESDWKNNYTLSYLRAQYLNEFWKENGIDINSIPKCELIISGSGEGGVPRIVPNEDDMHLQFPDIADYTAHWKDEEKKNQRFLIHIVPVIGNIDETLKNIEKLGKRL